jgi:hypothetical protein
MCLMAGQTQNHRNVRVTSVILSKLWWAFHGFNGWDSYRWAAGSGCPSMTSQCPCIVSEEAALTSGSMVNVHCQGHYVADPNLTMSPLVILPSALTVPSAMFPHRDIYAFHMSLPESTGIWWLMLDILLMSASSIYLDFKLINVYDILKFIIFLSLMTL